MNPAKKYVFTKRFLMTVLLCVFFGNTVYAIDLDRTIGDIIKNAWSTAVFSVYGDLYIIELPLLDIGFDISMDEGPSKLSMADVNSFTDQDLKDIQEKWENMLGSLAGLNTSIYEKMKEYSKPNPVSVILIEDVCGDGRFDDVHCCIMNGDIVLKIRDIRKLVYVIYNRSSLEEAERELSALETKAETKTKTEKQRETEYIPETDSASVMMIELETEPESETKPDPTTGDVEGTITYYNDNASGHLADTNAFVLLIPADPANADIETDKLTGDNLRVYDFGKGVYSSSVDELGTYTLNDVPAGEYLAWIVSGNTHTEDRIDAYDIIDGRAVNIYFASTASEADEVLPEKDAYNIAEAIGYCRSHMVRIKVYRGETIRLDYDFE